MSKMNTCFVIGCIYDQSKVKSALRFVSFINGTFEAKFKIKVVLVINNPQISIDCSAIDNTELLIINGSNLNAEFGAWQEGVDVIRSQFELDSASKFIFFNDTVFNHFFPSFSGLCKFVNVVQSDNDMGGVVSGQLQILPSVGQVNGVNIDKYICTAVFYLNYRSLEQLSFAILNVSVAELSKKAYNSSYELLCSYFDKDVLSYRIGYWLFGGQWYNSKKYDEFNKSLLLLKLTMIINEKLMSAILSKSQVHFINSLKSEKRYVLNFLHAMMHFGVRFTYVISIFLYSTYKKYKKKLQIKTKS